MVCSDCGSKAISPEARFCPNCGSELNKINQDESEHQEKVFASTNQKLVPTKPTLLSRIILVGLLIFSVGIYAAALIPAFAGIRPSSLLHGEGTSFIAWNAILFYILFRRKNKKGWVGVIAGLVFGFVVLGTAEGIVKTKQNDLGYILSHSPEYLAIQKYDSAEYQRIKTELETLSKEPNITKAAVLAKLTPMLMTVVQRALPQTTDHAVVQLARAKLASLEEVANANVDDCYRVLSGKVDNASLSRIAGYSSKQSEKASNEAVALVIEGATDNVRQPFIDDEARYSRLMAQVEVKLKSVGLSTDYAFSDIPGHTAKEGCVASIQFYREALNLKEPDRAFLLRKLLM